MAVRFREQRVVLATTDVRSGVELGAALTDENVSGHDKLATVLGRLCREDPTLRVHQDAQTGDTLLAGMGELHLEVYCDVLREQHGIEL